VRRFIKRDDYRKAMKNIRCVMENGVSGSRNFRGCKYEGSLGVFSGAIMTRSF